MFENETPENIEKKPINRHKTGKIICCICGKEYIAEQRTLNNRYKRYGDNYCKKCQPKQNHHMTHKQIERLKKMPHKKADPIKTYTISSGIELEGKRCIDKICYKCERCGNAVIRKCDYVKKTYKRYNQLICPECARKDMKPTEEDRKRGMENRRKNMLEKYGVEHINQLPENREKMRELAKKRTTIYFHRDMERAIVKKYNNREDMYKLIAENREKTVQERYGVRSTLLLPEVREKIRQTSMERYGMEVPSNNPESRKKANYKYKGTCYKKYGVSSYTKREEFREVLHNRVRYRYKGIDFNTKWLLCFYIYYEELGKTVEFDVPEWVYLNSDGKEDKYRPDCKMDGKYYDMRGDEYYYGGKRYEKFEKSTLYKFMKEKGIKIITLDEISMYYEYIEWRWGGLEYIDQFKVLEDKE